MESDSLATKKSFAMVDGGYFYAHLEVEPLELEEPVLPEDDELPKLEPEGPLLEVEPPLLELLLPPLPPLPPPPLRFHTSAKLVVHDGDASASRCAGWKDARSELSGMATAATVRVTSNNATAGSRQLNFMVFIWVGFDGKTEWGINQ